MGNTVSTHPTDPPRREIDSGALYQQAAYVERFTDPKTGEPRTRHHAAVWVGSVSLIDASGRRQRRKVTGRTEADARRKLRSLRNAKSAKELPTGSRKTVDWLMGQWLASPVAAGWDASTHDYCAANARLHVLPTLGRLTLKQVDARDARNMIQAWVNGLNKTLAPKSVRHAHATLSGALNWAMAPEQGY